jgi:hypothetical protein
MLVASLFHLGDFDSSKPSVIIFIAILAVTVPAIAGLFVIMERRHRPRTAATAHVTR